MIGRATEPEQSFLGRHQPGQLASAAVVAREIAIGVGAGLVATFLGYAAGRPRVALVSFGEHPTCIGRMFDAQFRLNRWGWMDPGTCTLTIKWKGGSAFAKSSDIQPGG